jgi:hypothetical protein
MKECLSTREYLHSLYDFNKSIANNFIWNYQENNSIYLLEALLEKLPLPIFYVQEDSLGKYYPVLNCSNLYFASRFIKEECNLIYKNNLLCFEDLSNRDKNILESFKVHIVIFEYNNRLNLEQIDFLKKAYV